MVLEKIKEIIKKTYPKLVIPSQFFPNTQRIFELFQKPKTQGHNKIKEPTLVQTLDPLG
jgi:hypothetical protein